MDQNAKEESDRSRSRFWFLVLLAFALWIVAKAAYRALHQPWTWTLDQVVLVCLIAVVPVGLYRWLSIWRTDGWDAVKRRWKTLGETAFNPPKRDRLFYWKVAMWIVVMLALVFVFYWREQHQVG